MTARLERTGPCEGLPFIERLGLLLEQEYCSRERRKHERLIRQGRFKLKARVQEIDYQHPRNITPSQIAQLARGNGSGRHKFY